MDKRRRKIVTWAILSCFCILIGPVKLLQALTGAIWCELCGYTACILCWLVATAVCVLLSKTMTFPWGAMAVGCCCCCWLQCILMLAGTWPQNPSKGCPHCTSEGWCAEGWCEDGCWCCCCCIKCACWCTCWWAVDFLLLPIVCWESDMQRSGACKKGCLFLLTWTTAFSCLLWGKCGSFCGFPTLGPSNG